MKPKTKALLSLAKLVLIFLISIVPVFYLLQFVRLYLGVAIPFNAVMIGIMIGLGFKAGSVIEQLQSGASQEDK